MAITRRCYAAARRFMTIFGRRVPAAFGGARSDLLPALVDGSMRGKFCRVMLARDAMVWFARQDG